MTDCSLRRRHAANTHLSAPEFIHVATSFALPRCRGGDRGRFVDPHRPGHFTGAKPHIVFVTGDCEYRSEITMPLVAEILEKKHGMQLAPCATP